MAKDSQVAEMLSNTTRKEIALEKNKISFAKHKWEIIVPFLVSLMGFLVSSATALMIILDNLSIQITNRRGESGYPYLKPLDGRKKDSLFPFQRNVRDMEETQFNTRFIN